jgi:hypothetical protein
MVILVNFGTTPLKVEYTNGNKTFVRQLPTNKFVAMKELNVSEQISNRHFLANHNHVTIYDFERGTFFNRNAATPTGNTIPFVLVGGNLKAADITTVSSTGFSGTTTASAMTFTANAIAASTVFGFVTSANTAMANNTISAATIGNNRYISFSGTSMTTSNWYDAVISGATLPAGVTITGYGTGRLGTGTTFFLSASTAQAQAGFSFLQRLM